MKEKKYPNNPLMLYKLEKNTIGSYWNTFLYQIFFMSYIPNFIFRKTWEGGGLDT